MSDRKLRVLVVNEASWLNTGYSTIGRNLISRWIRNPKLEVVELGCYGSSQDPRSQVPWKFYGNLPNSQEESQVYEGNPLNQFGTWKFENVCLDFLPDVVCIPPGNLVMTDSGYRPIEEIKVGDSVLTHKSRFRKVTRTYKHQHEGKLIRIRFRGCKEPLKLTPEHPVYILRKRNQTNQKKSMAKIYSGVEPEFVMAKDVKPDDLIVLPTFQLDNTSQEIDITEHLYKFVEIDKKIKPDKRDCSNGVNRFIKLDEDFGRLIGYMVSDGCVHDTYIDICFHTEEKRFVDDVIILIERVFGVNATFSKVDNKESLVVRASSVIVAKFLSSFIGKNVAKNIPSIAWKSNKNFLRGIISGLVRGDGDYSNNSVGMNTARKYLAHNYRMLCTLVGIPVNLQKGVKNTPFGRSLMYDVEGYGTSANMLHSIANKFDSSRGTIDNAVRRARTTQIIDDRLVASIKYVKSDDYFGQVYNLEVEEDNSYVVQQACVHNCDFRDAWMISWEAESPFRDYFHWAIMPAVDSLSQDPSWIDCYSKADAVFGYTDWALDVLSRESNGAINCVAPAPPAIDPNVFQPVQNKQAFKERFFRGSSIVFGTVMRNQKRKLYDDLIKSFERYIELCYEKGNSELADRSFLYIHTSVPDSGWNIPRILSESSVAHKIVFTYICRDCKLVEPKIFAGPVVPCSRCPGQMTCPNVQVGVDDPTLAQIYNLFDVYVQYSICEGFSLPQAEAGACGVPLITVDFSAMHDVGQKLSGRRIGIAKLFRESETHMYRVYPNDDELVKALYDYAIMPDVIRAVHGRKAREGVLKHYTWDNTAKVWMDYFDGLKPKNLWDSPPRLHQPNLQVPNIPNNEDFIQWCILNILGDPSYLHSYFHSCLLRDLNNGCSTEHYGGLTFNEDAAIGSKPRQIPFDRQAVVNKLLAIRNKINFWEQKRWGMLCRRIV